MYAILNTKNRKLCTTWHYPCEKQLHYTWKTPEEIVAANTYHNDGTKVKSFLTKYAARKFIQHELNNNEDVVIVRNFK